jgi:outer membrane immunogenic protein
VRKSNIAVAVALSATLLAGSDLAQAQSYNWSGVYGGLHAGYGKASERAADVLQPIGGWFTPFGPARGHGFDFDSKGFVGGGQVGAQHQWGNFVLGAELSLTGAKLSESFTSPYYPTSDTVTGKVNSIFMATARLGWAQQNWLIYAKGGFASAEVEFNAFDRVNNFGYAQSKRQGGYAIGAGVEYGLTQNITLGLEYMRVDLGAKTTDGTRTGGTRESYRTDAEIDTVTLRLNYLIGRSTAAPAPLK